MWGDTLGVSPFILHAQAGFFSRCFSHSHVWGDTLHALAGFFSTRSTPSCWNRFAMLSRSGWPILNTRSLSTLVVGRRAVKQDFLLGMKNDHLTVEGISGIYPVESPQYTQLAHIRAPMGPRTQAPT